ncbi:hypothetical protein DPMN_191464 [Dreissena polymorpha]|uniref:Uncharacterized protein n=1 Tax=Dreissena polymorpha TaxID=45954 RepID=A0A9D4BC72_DREPO|nr:hypothetical protein DPMN_191464 [Dreissena polymorpha]
MLSLVILRIEKVESEVFDKEMENNRLSQTISDMKCKLNVQKDGNERLRKELKQQESNCEMKINELEQYSRQSNIKIDVIPDHDKESSNETTEIV